jgi:hypothetical protein
MARTYETISLTIRPETLRAVNAAAQSQKRSRSQFIDLTLERAMTGTGRLEALQSIADQGLADFAAEHAREKAPNASAVIAEASQHLARRRKARERHQKTTGVNDNGIGQQIDAEERSRNRRASKATASARSAARGRDG